MSRLQEGGGTEYCGGFHDEHGQWTNGFPCRKWGEPDQTYCCGPSNNRFCCPEPPIDDVTESSSTESDRDHLTLPTSYMIALVCGVVVVVAVSLLAICCFCRCCVFYKRRKRNSSQAETVCRSRHENRALASIVNYAACPGQSPPYTEVARYPLDDPPPYPGHEQTYSQEDKARPGPSGHITRPRDHLNHAHSNNNMTEHDTENGNLSTSSPWVSRPNEITTHAQINMENDHRHRNEPCDMDHRITETSFTDEGASRLTAESAENSRNNNNVKTRTVAKQHDSGNAIGGTNVQRPSSERSASVSALQQAYIIVSNGKGQYSVEL